MKIITTPVIVFIALLFTACGSGGSSSAEQNNSVVTSYQVGDVVTLRSDDTVLAQDADAKVRIELSEHGVRTLTVLSGNVIVKR